MIKIVLISIFIKVEGMGAGEEKFCFFVGVRYFRRVRNGVFLGRMMLGIVSRVGVI